MSPSVELVMDRPNPAAERLMLRPQDRLVAVNGTAFQGTEEDLVLRFTKAKGRALALTFARGDLAITVLSDTARLGTWSEAPLSSPPHEGERLNPDVLTNWEFLADRAGVYDLHPLRSSSLALIAPPIWLMQQRLWLPLSALIAAAMVAAAVSWLMFLAVYLMAGLHLWHSGAAYFRKDRLARGFTPRIVLAAPSERVAHQSYLRIEPAAQFLFAATRATLDEQVG